MSILEKIAAKNRKGKKYIPREVKIGIPPTIDPAGKASPKSYVPSTAVRPPTAVHPPMASAKHPVGINKILTPHRLKIGAGIAGVTGLGLAARAIYNKRVRDKGF